jgi:hypothetical protein
MEKLLVPFFTMFEIARFDLIYLSQITFFSPILVFYTYKFIFFITCTKFSYYVIGISMLSLVIIGFTPLKLENNHFFNLYVLWQIIMAFGLQLILHQEDIKALFKTKSE